MPFEVPSNWTWTTLGEIFTLQAGKNITAKDISAKQDTVKILQRKIFLLNKIQPIVIPAMVEMDSEDMLAAIIKKGIFL